MAAPIVDSVSFNPSVVVPGGAFVATVLAHDPDERIYQISGVAQDAQGNSGTLSGELRVSDPLTYSLQLPAGFFAVQRGTSGVFDCRAP
jgi:hypothetical protein